jgi:tetratricopeptide (TPR) repeat protein
MALLAACSSAPPAKDTAPAPVAVAAPSGAVPGVASPAAGAGIAVAAASAPEAPVPPRAAQQYAQALQMMKAGRNTDAELEFKQLAAAYPQFSGPQVNLGILYLKDSRLTDAEAALKSALQINAANAKAASELGIVERRLGKFADAEAAYQKAIAAEPNYADAHLNLGVLYDLYLSEPKKALEQFERYVEIAGGENKQVNGWVVELRKRVGAPAPPKKEPA